MAAFFTWLNAKTGKELESVNVTVFDVKKLSEHMIAAGRKPAGLNRRLASLRTFFAWAVATELATTNPATTVQGQGEVRRPPKALASQEVYRLQRTAAEQCQLTVAKGDSVTSLTVIAAWRDEALLNLLLYTGLRVGEAAALRLDDVILGERSGKVIVRSGKGRKYRELPLHKEARQGVVAYLKSAAGRPWRPLVPRPAAGRWACVASRCRWPPWVRPPASR